MFPDFSLMQWLGLVVVAAPVLMVGLLGHEPGLPPRQSPRYGVRIVEPILEAMGKAIFHAGGPGAGQAVKICNNMMLAINMIGVSEGFLLAQKLGLG